MVGVIGLYSGYQDQKRKTDSLDHNEGVPNLSVRRRVGCLCGKLAVAHLPSGCECELCTLGNNDQQHWSPGGTVKALGRCVQLRSLPSFPINIKL